MAFLFYESLEMIQLKLFVKLSKNIPITVCSNNISLTIINVLRLSLWRCFNESDMSTHSFPYSVMFYMTICINNPFALLFTILMHNLKIHPNEIIIQAQIQR